MNDENIVLKSLNEKQRKICLSNNNILLTACPGSGKTRVITHRLAYIAKANITSHKLNIAITYTNRAANEIEKRIEDMNIDTTTIWSGTIHQFCMTFIIRPYSMYSSRLSKGYKIIDEYVKEKYYKEIAGILNIKYSYEKELYSNKQIEAKYKELLIRNKEIDFDMILEYSLELLRLNKFISENISKIIRSIHVDEYQDTNEYQYLILSELIKSNININLLFVGDINQAIFGGLGGIAKNIEEINELFPIVFQEETLDKCYRSTQRLIDYYSNYEVVKTNAVSEADYKDEIGIIKYDNVVSKEELPIKIAEIIKKKLDEGVEEHQICIVAPQWTLMFPIANKLRELLPNNNFDAPDISPIKYDALNPFYLIAKLLFTRNSKYVLLRRKEAKEILNIFRDEYKLYIPDNITKLDILKQINSILILKDDALKTLRSALEKITIFLNIDKNNIIIEGIEQFMEKVEERIKKHEFTNTVNVFEKSFKEKNGIVISSIHGVKGEEYNTIIGYGLLNGYVPYWDYIRNKDLIPKRIEEAKRLLYVLASRAKKDLYLFSESNRETKGKKAKYMPTDELYATKFLYD